MVEHTLVPRTQGSAPSAVRCRAGAHLAAYFAASWVPALRRNAKSVAARPGHESEPPHLPVQTGFRFSLNAFNPSLASSVIASSAIWLSV
ncbi:hypothetical protein BwSF12_33150 [Bradyrhizobium ottawaense]|nr:hypothetical protein BwSH14_03000 [Bradyrhizobium ottawaense]GMO33739.1 hypothetical protein BwSF12_33150 [Bradyrhizobium ottawaense]GMO70815.1 hypothetical protein BwSH17_27920 [Bradyrhizobium ottawaense]GMO90711.1 hypothetical protein BwSF19_65130 [Bradyrhizobium ottawaense]